MVESTRDTETELLSKSSQSLILSDETKVSDETWRELKVLAMADGYMEKSKFVSSYHPLTKPAGTTSEQKRKGNSEEPDRCAEAAR